MKYILCLTCDEAQANGFSASFWRYCPGYTAPLTELGADHLEGGRDTSHRTDPK